MKRGGFFRRPSGIFQIKLREIYVLFQAVLFAKNEQFYAFTCGWVQQASRVTVVDCRDLEGFTRDVIHSNAGAVILNQAVIWICRRLIVCRSVAVATIKNSRQ